MNAEQAWDHFVQQVMNVAGGIEQPERAVAAGKLYAALCVAEALAAANLAAGLACKQSWENAMAQAQEARKPTSESWIQLEALLEDYMGSEVDREMANAIKALAKGYAHDHAYAAAAVAEARAPLVEALETGLFQLEIYPNHVYRELGKGRRDKRGWCDLCDALDDVRAALAKETP